MERVPLERSGWLVATAVWAVVFGVGMMSWPLVGLTLIALGAAAFAVAAAVYAVYELGRLAMMAGARARAARQAPLRVTFAPGTEARAAAEEARTPVEHR